MFKPRVLLLQNIGHNIVSISSYQPTAGNRFEVNVPSGAYVWSGQAASTGIHPVSEQNTNQRSGSRYEDVMQQQNTPSGALMWSGQGTSTGRISSGK